MTPAGDRLTWLLDVLAVDDTEVGRVLAGGAATARRLRAGALATDEQLAAIATYLGVEPEFFGDDSTEVDRIQEQVLDGVLRDCGVWACLICRTPVPSAERRREHLRKVLHSVRPASLRSANAVPRHDERPGHEGGGPPMTAPVDQARLRAWCHDLVHELGMRQPFDPHELCRRLGGHRGRQIRVRAVDLGSTTGVGHLVPRRRTDLILVEQTAPVSQQALVIYHEVIHLARGHLDVGDPLSCGLETYADWREREAEIGARTLSALSRARPRPNLLPVAAGPAEHSIAAAFGFVARDRTS